MVKNLPANAEDTGDECSIPGLGRILEEEMATHSSILAWRIPQTEEPGGLPTLACSSSCWHQRQRRSLRNPECELSQGPSLAKSGSHGEYLLRALCLKLGIGNPVFQL